MKANLHRRAWAQVAGFVLWPIVAFAHFPDLAQNLADCKDGREACDRSKLNQAQSAEVARADKQRNLSNCRNGFDRCDRSKLSQAEATALAVADHGVMSPTAKTA
jgi:uncharacterized protein YgiB involved in biofilm formation